MKKMILVILITLILTSCGEDTKVLEKETKENISFSNPKNDLEEDINARELNLDNNNKDELLDLAKSYLAY